MHTALTPHSSNNLKEIYVHTSTKDSTTVGYSIGNISVEIVTVTTLAYSCNKCIIIIIISYVIPLSMRIEIHYSNHVIVNS